MTLIELGALGEFIGAIGVVVTLVYLALQIRHNTRAVRSSMHQDMIESTLRIAESLSDNSEVVRIVIKADAELKYGRVIEVLDAVREVGITRLAMATRPAY